MSQGKAKPGGSNIMTSKLTSPVHAQARATPPQALEVLQCAHGSHEDPCLSQTFARTIRYH